MTFDLLIYTHAGNMINYKRVDTIYCNKKYFIIMGKGDDNKYYKAYIYYEEIKHLEISINYGGLINE